MKGKLAIIPARGGSKRIPRKNIKDFLGRPIISYSIQAAINCDLFDEVMVSTDDQEIAELAKSLGANVPFLRSADNSGDHSSTMDVINEVLSKYLIEKGLQFSSVCCIYPTAPLIKIKDLIEGYKLLINKNLDSVFPVVQFSYPIWRGLKKERGDYVRMLWPENLNSRSQDMEPTFHDAGQWYWFNPERIKDNLFSNNSMSVFLDEYDVQDIDNESDWKLAELKYKLNDEA